MRRDVDRLRRIALVSVDGRSQAELADYLSSVGFDVRECDDLPVPSLFAAMVLVGDAPSMLITRVRTWLKLARTQRVIVVTGKPAVLRDLAATHADRLFVLGRRHLAGRSWTRYAPRANRRDPRAHDQRTVGTCLVEPPQQASFSSRR
jgi:hypothetical protein